MSLFGTAGIRGSVQSFVSPQLAVAIGKAVGTDSSHTVVGRDSRLSGPALQSAIVSGLKCTGSRVTVGGVVPTPALAHASRGKYGIMVTASHNPPSDNGIKIFVNGIEADEEMESEITRRVENGVEMAQWQDWKTAESMDILSKYRDSLISYALTRQCDLSGLTIALSCGNGTAGIIAPAVFRDLNAQVSALNANPDGHFSARDSKPTPESLQAFRRFVSRGDFSFGLAYDGDADRVVVVSSSGDIIHEDTIIAILGEHSVRESTVSDPVVITTPNASSRIDDRINEAGGRVERCPLGALHEGIASIESNGQPGTSVVFAAEPWKHIHPDFGGWIDGILSGIVLGQLAASVGGFETLREPVEERPYQKLNVECPDELKERAMEILEHRVDLKFPDARINTDYGIRVEQSDGSWFLIRPSGTEPYLRIYVEAPNDIEELAKASRQIVVEAVSELTTSN